MIVKDTSVDRLETIADSIRAMAHPMRIRILEILESESNKENSKDKFNRVDLKVKNDKEELIIIEVQYEREFDYLQRIMFGTSKVITEHLTKSAPNYKVPKSFSLNIHYSHL